MDFTLDYSIRSIDLGLMKWKGITMIPKIIHYCWFGNTPLPEDAQNCIASWKKFFPDYEIKEWNESNFDFNCCEYVKEAYTRGKWAFVSDYARFKILYEYGGLYFDTDVEVIKNFDDILVNGGFMGCEESSKATSVDNYSYKVAAGLGLGVAAGNIIYKEILEYYNEQHFIRRDGSVNPTTVVLRVTQLLQKHGFKGNGTIEKIGGISIYPPDYFCPMNNDTGELTITDNTHSIHYYSSSWYTKTQKEYQYFLRNNVKNKKTHTLQHIVCSLVYRIKFNIEVFGVKGTINKLFRKILGKVSW